MSITNRKAVQSIVDIPTTLAQFERDIMAGKFLRDPISLGQASDGTRYLVYEREKGRTVKKIYNATDFFRT